LADKLLVPVPVSVVSVYNISQKFNNWVAGIIGPAAHNVQQCLWAFKANFSPTNFEHQR
jgi:hypothetical protein